MNTNVAKKRKSSSIGKGSQTSSEEIIQSLTYEISCLKRDIKHKDDRITILESSVETARTLCNMYKAEAGYMVKETKITNPYLRVSYKKGVAV